MPKYNLELFKTLIINFTNFYSNVESKILCLPPIRNANLFNQAKKMRHQFANFLRFQFLVA